MIVRTVEAPAHVGEQICIQGWLHAVRELGGISFIVVRDGWGLIQAVTERKSDLTALAGLANGTIVALSGTVVATAQTASGVELHNPAIEVLVPISAEPPLTMHKNKLNAALPTLLDNAVVANRHPQQQAIFRLTAGVMAAFRTTLNAQQFTEIQSPKLVEAATEGGANVFAVDYFGKPAYLAQSPQFYKQIMVGVFQRVYEVGPVFRAEPHNTSRHINQYTSLDVEFGFINNHFDVMAQVEAVMRGIFEGLREGYSAELETLAVKQPRLPDTIPHIHFAEALELIYALHGVDERSATDLTPQGERWLGEWALREHNSDFLFVTGYPMSKRPFYTHPDPANPSYSNSFDLLFRGTELITGGQRRHLYADYIAALEAVNLPTAPFETYLQAFKHGMPPHGGFAIGLERLIMQLVGLPNLRMATLFPRDINRLSP